MDISDTLVRIQPDLTLYGLFVTFSVVSLATARHFWQYHETLVSENAERLRELVVTFRRIHVEPVLASAINSMSRKAYTTAISTLKDEAGEPSVGEEGDIVHTGEAEVSVSTPVLDRVLRDLLARDHSGDEFLDSPEAAQVLEQVDHLYDRYRSLWRTYNRLCSSCRTLTYASSGLGILFLLGLMELVVQFSSSTRVIWGILTGEVFFISLLVFARLEVFRARLLRLWQDVHIHGH